MRMSKVSVGNCRVADRFKIEKHEGMASSASWVFLVKAYRNGNVAYLTGGDGFPLEYSSKNLAYRAVRRLRSDVPITEI